MNNHCNIPQLFLQMASLHRLVLSVDASKAAAPYKASRISRSVEKSHPNSWSTHRAYLRPCSSCSTGCTAGRSAFEYCRSTRNHSHPDIGWSEESAARRRSGSYRSAPSRSCKWRHKAGIPRYQELGRNRHRIRSRKDGLHLDLNNGLLEYNFKNRKLMTNLASR